MTKAETDKSRTASCACQKFSIELAGDPQIVSICNCTQCQKRTGSAFGMSAFFDKSQRILTSGDRSTYNRRSDAGRSLSLHFCPNCGTTLFWELDMLPDKIGVAVGCFADPTFPSPDRAVWCQTAHEWLAFPPSVKTYTSSAN